MTELATRYSEAELAALSASLEFAPASKVVRWAVDTFGDDLCITASFQDSVLLDVATKVKPDIEVVFIDTRDHFPETYETIERVRRRYDLNLKIVRVPEPDVPFHIVDHTFVKPGKGQSFTRCSVRNLTNGKVVERTSPTAAKAEIKVKMGAMSMTFAGTVEVVEQDDAAHHALMRIKSREVGGQGHANADVAFALADGGGSIHTAAQITGKAA